MTCREKLKIEHPEMINESIVGGCWDCPHRYGYLDRPEFCLFGSDADACTRCWDREIPEDSSQTVSADEPRIVITYDDCTKETLYGIISCELNPQANIFKITCKNQPKRTYVSLNHIVKIESYRD